MSTSSAHADSEKPFLWQTEPLRFNNVEKNGRDQAEGKAETKRQKYKDDNIVGRMRGEQKVQRNKIKINCTVSENILTKHH